MKGFIEQGFNQSRIIAALFIFALVMTGLLMQPEKSYAPPVGCEVGIGKEAIPSDGTEFHFVVTGPASSPEFDLVSGDAAGIVVSGGGSVDIVEEQLEGWVLADVDCETENVIATDIENGIRLFCSPNGGAAQCTFFNQEVGNIPTLSEWGMISAVVGLGLIGVFFAVRRKRAASQA